MAYMFYNPNPYGNLVGDCVIRAISIATDNDWDAVYLAIALKGFDMKDMPSSNSVWGAYLRSKGFKRYIMPNDCPDCFTVKDFSEERDKGCFLLATGTHLIAVIDGNYYDTWDSGSEIPTFYWKKEEN